MSGPVTAGDVEPAPGRAAPELETVEVVTGRASSVGSVPVRRTLPRRARRTVGSWCFVDHMGPVSVALGGGLDVAPHPHLGLQTVTWLFAGEAVHRDSLGSEQALRPGQLNLMSAGSGIAHSEESTGAWSGELHGVQLWLAQPDRTRTGPGNFEHHGELPSAGVGRAVAVVLLGSFANVSSPAQSDGGDVGVELHCARGTSRLELDESFEYAVVVTDGVLGVDGRRVEEGQLAYLGEARSECALSAGGDARALLLGGPPCREPILMWWNFIGRSREELSEAYRSWQLRDGRFGAVASALDPIEGAPPPWERPSP